jgi:RimJ/RimL family protein N-acetyltransferase
MGVVIREAGVEDAEGVHSYMREMVSEPGLYIGFEPGEFEAMISVENERSWIEGHAEKDSSVMFIAVETSGERVGWNVGDGEVVGLLDCTGTERRAMRHETTLGISVKKEWRGQGIGRRLMERALEWAEGNEVIKRVQLEVYAENVGARKLYEELGFVEEGVRRRAAWKQGRWMDSVIMGKLV